MLNQNKIDLRLILSFTDNYEKLFKKGEITAQQLDQILSLLDKYNKYSSEEFKEKLKQIFA